MSCGRSKFKPFGYALNYAKEIASDRAYLAQLERARDAGWVKSDELETGAYYYGLHHLAIENEQIATSLGLDNDDRAALADALEIHLTDWHRRTVPEPSFAIDATNAGAWYRRGEAIAKRLTALWEGDLYSAARLRKMITHAKATLARHVRNERKYG